MKVLIVDDVKPNADLLVAGIEDLCDGGVYCASRATEAIELSIRLVPDLILMDVSLPDFDGITATQILKTNHTTCHIPVITVSAHALASYRARAMAAGSADYLTKPVSIRHLRGIVESYRGKLSRISNCVEESTL